MKRKHFWFTWFPCGEYKNVHLRSLALSITHDDLVGWAICFNFWWFTSGYVQNPQVSIKEFL